MSITTISRVIEWDMGHRLQNHESLCFNPHGHRYKAEVFVEGDVVDAKSAPDRGMVADYGFLKEILQEMIIGRLDHAFMVEETDVFAAHLAHFQKHIGRSVKIFEVPFAPTAEKIAEWIFKRMSGAVAFKVVKVIVWETPSCKAVYRP